MARICETPDIEPRFFYLTGFCLLKADRRAEAKPWLVKALDGAARHIDTWNVTTARTSARVAAEVGRAAGYLRDDALLERSATVYVSFRSAATFVEKGPTSVSLDPSRNPVFLWARRLVKMGRFREAFKLLTGPAGALFPHLPGALAPDLTTATSADKFVAAVEMDLTAAGDHLTLAAFLVQSFASEPVAATHLEKVRPRFPASTDLHFELARLLGRRQEWDAAFKVARTGLEGAAPEDAGRERLVLLAARLASLAGSREAGRPLLEAAAARRTPSRAAHWAEAYAATGDRATALALYRKAAEQGEAPSFQLATFHYLAGEFETALRFYNRHLRDNSRTAAWPEIEELPQSVPEFNVSADHARSQILEKLGADFFIDRLVAKHAGAITADDDAMVDKLLKRLETGSTEDRMAAREAVVKLDPRLAPAVSRGLKSSDEWTKIVVREILNEWAEPR